MLVGVSGRVQTELSRSTLGWSTLGWSTLGLGTSTNVFVHIKKVFSWTCNKFGSVDDHSVTRPPTGGPPQGRNTVNRILINLANRYRELGQDTDDTGGVAAEYGVLLAGIVAVVALAAAALGTRVGGLFDGILA